jgi:hypothetical protein
VGALGSGFFQVFRKASWKRSGPQRFNVKTGVLGEEEVEWSSAGL